MYKWIGRTHGLDFMHKLDTVLVSIFVVFVGVLIVLFRKSNSVWMDWTYAWIGRTHGLDLCMDWTQCW